jgi:hypothetical protein
MLIVLVAVLVAAVCIGVSARRLWFAANATVLDPDDVVAAMKRVPGPSVVARLREAVAHEPAAEWERELLGALAEPRAETRVALVNEQLTELDHRIQRWARVPRVCASLATSIGILLGTLVLRDGLANAPDLSGDLGELFVRDVIGRAFSVASCGIVATTFCLGAHAQARRMTRRRLEAADRMVEKLESLRNAAATDAV